MEHSKFDKAINQSDLEEWIIETFPGWPEGDVRMILDHLDEMPDVLLNYVIHAKWLKPDKNYSDKIWRKCSNCNTHIEKYSKYVSFMGTTNYFEHILNYCPICGAKMDGENEDATN